jgi:hypothetical protein
MNSNVIKNDLFLAIVKTSFPNLKLNHGLIVYTQSKLTLYENLASQRLLLNFISIIM